MKRLLVSLLAILYLAAGAGFTLREHYCMGQMIGASIEHATHQPGDVHRCDRCGMEKKRSDNGCCKDKVKLFKSSPDQLGAKAVTLHAPLMAGFVPAFPLPSQPEPCLIIAAIAAAPTHAPPLRSGPPLFLRMRRIRI